MAVGGWLGAIWLGSGGQGGSMGLLMARWSTIVALRVTVVLELLSDGSSGMALSVGLRGQLGRTAGRVAGVTAGGGDHGAVAGLLRSEDLPQVVDGELAVVGASATCRSLHEICQRD